MLGQLLGSRYMPILKWKLGEYSAIRSVSNWTKGLIAPLFVMPPSGEFDHERQRVLSPTEHIKFFGSRLHSCWGKRIAFIDAVHVDDKKHREGLSSHPLTELVERARLEGAIACPVTNLDRTPEYQDAVKRFVLRHKGLPICIRSNAWDIEDHKFAVRLRSLLDYLRCEPSMTVIALDFGSVHVRNVSEFSGIVAEQINQLPHLHDWLTIVLSSTSFPDKIWLRPGEVGKFPRTELAIYEALLSNWEELLRIPIFGDYGVEHPGIVNRIKAPPTASIRYSKAQDFFVFKGKSTRKPNGYEAIFPVADMTVCHKEFMGREYSRGDEYIAKLSIERKETGNAATWRWAATDHHLTLTTRWIAAHVGLEAEGAEPKPFESAQSNLFDR